MSAVSNTGPLIALAKVDQLDLLAQLFGHVHIPPAVYRELLSKSGNEGSRLDVALESYIRVAPRPEMSSTVLAATEHLDLGEREAVALAHETGHILMIDDRQGRSAARRPGLSYTGVAGVLIRAKEVGYISKVGPLLSTMRREGYWLSDALLRQAAQLAGEEPGVL